MNFAKNKYGIAFMVIVAVAATHYFFFYKKCEEPMDITVAAIHYKKCEEPMGITVAVHALKCTLAAVNKPTGELREESCHYLRRGSQCNLSEEDKPKILEMIDAMVLDCTKKELEKENYCTDKVQEHLRR